MATSFIRRPFSSLRRMARFLFGVLFLLLSVVVAAVAKDGEEAGRPGASLAHRDNLPSSIAAASVPLIDDTGGAPMQIRTVQVYPEDQNSKVRVPGRYYHRPLLAFVVNPKPITGYPLIVHDIDTESDEHGSILLRFWVKLSTVAVRTECRRAVLLSDRANALHAAGSEDKVVVQPWPLEHMIIVCRHTGTQEVLGSVSTGGLSGVGDDLSFWVKYTPGALEKFKREVAKKRIEFVFYYTYVGIRTVDGSIHVKGDKDVSMVVRNGLTSSQTKRDAPIFQDERNAVARNISVKLERTIRAGHKDIVPLLNCSGMMDRMFEPAQTLSFQDLVKAFGNQKVEEQLAAYLKPLIANLNETKTESDLRYEIKEDEKTKATAPGGGFSVFGIVFGAASKESTERALNRLDHATGVTIAKGQNEEVYRPHHITFCKLREGWDRIDFDETTNVYLKVGSESTYIEDTAVPASFTESTALISLTLNQRIYIEQRLADKERCLASRKEARDELAVIHEEQVKLIEEIEGIQKKLQALIDNHDQPNGDTVDTGTLSQFKLFKPIWGWDPIDRNESKKRIEAFIGMRDLFNKRKSAQDLTAINSVLKDKCAALATLEGRAALLRDMIANQDAIVQRIDGELMVMIKR